MPTSHPGQIPALLSVIQASYATSFLEIGPGFGKWGVLVREYMDISDGREKYDKADWKCRIDCIEAFPKYITPLHRFVYDTIYEGDARGTVPNLEQRYDMALMIDVLEHFSREDGTLLVRALQQRCDAVLISVPKDIGDQGAAFGNVFETHRHLWTKGDLQAFTFPSASLTSGALFPPAVPMITIPDPKSLIVYVGRNAKRVQLRQRLDRHPRFKAMAFKAMKLMKR